MIEPEYVLLTLPEHVLKWPPALMKIAATTLEKIVRRGPIGRVSYALLGFQGSSTFIIVQTDFETVAIGTLHRQSLEYKRHEKRCRQQGLSASTLMTDISREDIKWIEEYDRRLAKGTL